MGPVGVRAPCAQDTPKAGRMGVMKTEEAQTRAEDATTAPDEGSIGAEILGAIEAVVFASERPIGAARICRGLQEAGEGLIDPDAVDERLVERGVRALNEQYERSGRAFRIESVAGGYRVMTIERYASLVGALHKSRAQQKLSKAALETLAIIAYRQPITRADLEAIRGVSCGEVLRSLLERRLIAITGRAEVLGRPMLYGTTKAFLDAFGLRSIKDLPSTDEPALGAV